MNETLTKPAEETGTRNILNSDIKTLKQLGRYRRGRYKNQPDFVNPEPVVIPGFILPAELSPYIEEYKYNQKPELIKCIMSALSKLIIKMINQEISRYKVLQDMEKQELYNTAFISLHHAMLKFDVSKSTIYSFPRYLQGYIKRDLKKIVDSESELICCGIEGIEFMPEETACTSQAYRAKRLISMKIELKKAMDEMVQTGKVSAKNIRAFEMRHIEGRTYKEIAEKMPGKTAEGIESSIRRIMNSLQHKLRHCR